ncbi:hypothetical protein E2C01_079669 [Portunus trituberculatus]|uniref:Reverse transcriptase zinc-binding domain-containing protein n=1 Tax=Portunus trituberculatus TaxID=210409 RepID=A0A5B7ITD8_PORTR|nr:hypothetical protein [Portunus trituberculatus]
MKPTAAITSLKVLRLGHTTLSGHLHSLHLSPDPFCPWCRTTHETIKHFLLHCPRFHSHHTELPGVPALCPEHHNTQLAHLPGGLRRPFLPATYCPSPYLCLLEEDWPAITPVIPTQDYAMTHMEP